MFSIPAVARGALAAVLLSCLICPAGASAPQPGYPIVHVSKWQFDFTITSSEPFKLTINPSIENAPLPEAADRSIPTISGSQKVRASFAAGPMEPDIIFTRTIKPYDDSNDADVTVRSFKVEHPHCVCGENTLVELTAQASNPGGTWEPFEIEVGIYSFDQRVPIPRRVPLWGGRRMVAGVDSRRARVA